MAVDMFMKIEGIDGEKPLGEIEIESFSWGLSQSGAAAATGGAGAGKVQFQGFHFVTEALPGLRVRTAPQGRDPQLSQIRRRVATDVLGRQDERRSHQ